jgi:hypothetical protein
LAIAQQDIFTGTLQITDPAEDQRQGGGRVQEGRGPQLVLVRGANAANLRAE